MNGGDDSTDERQSGRTSTRSDRTRWIVVAAAAVIVLVVAGLVVRSRHEATTVDATASNGGATVEAPTTAPTTPSSAATSTTSGTSSTSSGPVAPSSSAPTDDTGSSAAPSETPAPTPQDACHDSTDPACGDFYWLTAPPANAAIVVHATPSSATVAAGELVVVTIDVSDADAPVYARAMEWEPPMIGLPAAYVQSRHGGWDPPAPTPGSATYTFSHVYATPGTYEALFTVQTATPGWELDPADPYGSWGTLTIPIAVTG